MLAKQEWRFLKQPNSLCARILKSKYLPLAYFFYAQLGYGPIYVWQSIFAVGELGMINLLKFGMIIGSSV